MRVSATLSRAISYILFIGNKDQREKFFHEAHYLAIALLCFGLGTWIVVYFLLPSHDDFNYGQGFVALAGMVLCVAFTSMSRTLYPLIFFSSIGAVFISYGYRISIEAMVYSHFWILPAGTIIILTMAPIFNGVFYYLLTATAVWLVLTLGYFPDASSNIPQIWVNVVTVFTVISGMGVNIAFLFLRVKNYHANSALAHMAFKDTLTGLNNRRAFNEQANKLQQENGRRKLFFLMIDIDDFKVINDTEGHGVGDEVLKKTAQIIARVSGEHLCARIGGEEFAVVFVGERDEACDFASNMVSQVAIGFAPDRKVSISIGVAEFVRGTDLSGNYSRADASLYVAKKTGKNRYVMASC